MDFPPRPEMSYEERQAASQQSIAAGGLPLNATDRLRDQASRQGTPEHIFTSDLSVDELLLTRQCGFEPLGQVMGSCIYHVGWYTGPGWSWGSGELSQLTAAYDQAWRLAIGRLQQEAKLLQGSGVVGVRITRATYDWASDLIEFASVGTAVREIGVPPLPETAMPFVSGLSGQDHFALRLGGFRPVGYCVGNCVWFQYASYQTYQATGGFGSWYNQELQDYTWAMYQARGEAMYDMQTQAQRVGASGVVGVGVESSYEPFESENYKGLIVKYFAQGTCVTRDLTAPRTVSVAPTVLISD